MSDDRDTFNAAVRKQFGDFSFKSINEKPLGNLTGSIRLDVALGIPFPEGRIIEIFGNPGAGKTTLSLSVLEQAAKNGKEVQILDQEGKLDAGLVSIFPNLRKKYVDNKETALRGDTGEAAFKIAELFLSSFPRSVLVIDSVDALIPEKVQEVDVGDPTVGGVARLMSAGCRRLKSVCEKSQSTVIFLNQIRSKIGGYGNPETTSGGNALKFYATQRIHLKDQTKGELIEDDEKHIVGQNVRFEIVKNGMAPPFVKGDFPLIYGVGIHASKELVDIACLIGAIDYDGKMITDKEGKKRHVKTFVSMVEADQALFTEIYKKVISEYPETYK